MTMNVCTVNMGKAGSDYKNVLRQSRLDGIEEVTNSTAGKASS